MRLAGRPALTCVWLIAGSSSGLAQDALIGLSGRDTRTTRAERGGRLTRPAGSRAETVPDVTARPA